MGSGFDRAIFKADVAKQQGKQAVKRREKTCCTPCNRRLITAQQAECPLRAISPACILSGRWTLLIGIPHMKKFVVALAATVALTACGSAETAPAEDAAATEEVVTEEAAPEAAAADEAAMGAEGAAATEAAAPAAEGAEAAAAAAEGAEAAATEATAAAGEAAAAAEEAKK